MQTKYVFVTGGVVSGLGKGITVASLGRLLKARGYKVITQKIDGYINIDPGNLDPLEHGEVFVTDDGAETDLDLGHYERFIDESLTENSAMTMGKIYASVLEKERKNYYKGRTVQVIPHITDEIKKRIRYSPAPGDIVLTEVGGTVGDIESLPILEAIRQIALEEGRENLAFIHITLVPHLDYIGEMKTKPTQHSVKELMSRGIQPDIIVCRSDRLIPAEMREKLGLFCNVEPRCIIQNNNADSIYEVPLLLEEEGLADRLCSKLGLQVRQPDLRQWRALVDKCKTPQSRARLGLVGQHAELWDAYLSVAEALRHAGINQGIAIDIEWLPAKKISKDECFAGLSGMVLAGSVGEEVCEGKRRALAYARTNKIPFLGIGAGMHSALGGGLKIDTGQRGAAVANLPQNSKTRQAYGKDSVQERFRNRFEIPAQLMASLADEGWLVSEDGTVAELSDHPWFVCVQFHPEYKSRLTKASPLFESFVKEVKRWPQTM